ncbi:MAG: hypothetical protein DRI34_02270 [Deltaproteobacteria bacterium]|nr:MAG: hypothetical protein DRI34_02270 [Deltaproteobacteria bacterium]
MKRLRLVAVALVFTPALVCRGGGFLQYEHAAVSTAMADARSALADDVSVVYYNPAAMCELTGLHLQLGTTATLPLVDYQAARQADPLRTYTRLATGQVVQVNDGMNDAHAKVRGFFPSHLYVSWRPESVPLAVGFGVNNPFGLGVAWPGDWDGRFITTESDLTTFFNQPTVALDLAQLLGFRQRLHLSVAVGYDLVWATARLGQHLDLRVAEMLSSEPIADPEGEMLMTGSALGHGFNLALYAEWPGRLAFGASLRSGVHLPFSGTARFSFNPAGRQALQLLATDIPASTTGRVDIDLPWHANLGLAWLGTERLKVALDLYLAFFQSYDELSMDFDCLHEQPACALAGDPVVANWHTSWQLSLGVEYRAWRQLRLRAGYAASFSPVPADTLEPSVPDGRQSNIGLGAGWRGDWWKLDVGYMLALWSVTKDNDVGGTDAGGNPRGKANGLYRTTAHMLAVSFSVVLFR